MLRAGRVADIPRLLEIERASFDGDRLSRRSFHHFLRKAKAALWVVETEGLIAGYALLLFHRGTSLARLYSLAVDPAAHGRGIGRALLDWSEDCALEHDCVAIRLEVRTDNAAAVALYERAGYRRFATLPHYYDDEADAWRYEKRLHPVPGPDMRNIPFVAQTTDFTCGPASLLMAMAAQDPARPVDDGEELRIWREATTVFMTSGHGGCGPHGLALAAHVRGHAVRAIVSEDGPLFLDTVRDLRKKTVMERVHQAFEADLAAAGIEVEIGPVTAESLSDALADGWMPLILVSTYRFNREKAPHWVVVTGVSDRFVLVNDPDVDEGLHKADVDCVHVPIPRAAFDKAARFGSTRLQAAVLVGPRAGSEGAPA